MKKTGNIGIDLKILAYFFLTVFALCCLYPFIYAISSAISGKYYVDTNRIILLPKEINSLPSRRYSKTTALVELCQHPFLTFFGTIFPGNFDFGRLRPEQKRLLFRRVFNFFLVFTMVFAGVVPQFLNSATQGFPGYRHL